jgi:hypothetical protein
MLPRYLTHNLHSLIDHTGITGVGVGGGGGGAGELDELTDVVITAPTVGQTLIHNGTTFVNVTAEQWITAFWEGNLTVGDGTRAIPIPIACTVTGVFLFIDTAPTGASVKLNVRKNGSTDLFAAGARPEIAIAAEEGQSTTLQNNDLSAGDYLQIDVDQIGSSTAGAGLTVSIVYRAR